MRRRFSLLLFALALTVTSLAGLSPTPAQASCTQKCVLESCGYECCTYTDCSHHCFNVFCGN
ncbi:MAG TPA: hypothetical protein VGK45_05450 [Thermoanaerobaculia bacterium]